MSAIVNNNDDVYKFLATDTLPVADVPFTIAGWFKSSDITLNQVIAAIDKTYDAEVDYHILGAAEASGNVAGDRIRAYTYNGSTYGIASSTSGFAANTWTHFAVVFAATNDRRVYRNGASKGTNTDDKTSTNHDEFIVGIRRRYNLVGQFQGKISQIAIWNKALSDANIADLGVRAVDPTTVESGNLIAYWPLYNDPNDDIGTNHLTEVAWSNETGEVYGTMVYDTEDEPTTGLPYKATTPSPSDAATNTTLDQATITWVNGGDATSYDVYYGIESGNLTQVSSGQAGLSFTITGITNGSPFNYLITRYWRIDSINENGTTTGDEWSFTTIRFAPPQVTYWYSAGGYYYQLLVQSDGTLGSHPVDGGVENTDFVIVTSTPNFIRTNIRLVAAAANTLWYESVT